MTKTLKKALLDALTAQDGMVFLRKTANTLGITHMTRDEAEGIMKSYLLRRPDMKAYYDGGERGLNSLFCGLWFAPASMEFETEAEYLASLEDDGDE